MDRSDGINQNLKNLSITPINIKQNQLNVWSQGGLFNPAKLDPYGQEKSNDQGCPRLLYSHV